MHPKSRVKNVINISSRLASTSFYGRKGPSDASEMEPVPDSEEEEESVGDSEEDYIEDEQSPVRARRSTRAAAVSKPHKNLPYSPKKTRSKKLFATSDNDDNDSGPAATRRSTRPRKGVKVNLDADPYSEDGTQSEDDEGSDDYSSRKAKAKSRSKKTKRVNKGTRPAYGHFRGIDELDYDSHSDEESAPLRAHRDFCEKCHRGPAHELMIALKKRPKGKKKKKTSDDEFDESGDEEDKLAALGGWVRWYAIL